MNANERAAAERLERWVDGVSSDDCPTSDLRTLLAALRRHDRLKHDSEWEHRKLLRDSHRLLAELNQREKDNIDEARALVERGNQTVEINCQCCQGHSLHGDPSRPGYCPECSGRCYVVVRAWTHWSMERKIDYWQARALIAEATLSPTPSHVVPNG